MQKIVFVGIILIIGLFSLQFSLAPLSASFFKTADIAAVAQPITTAPLQYPERNCKIIVVSFEEPITEIELKPTLKL